MQSLEPVVPTGALAGSERRSIVRSKPALLIRNQNFLLDLWEDHLEPQFPFFAPGRSFAGNDRASRACGSYTVAVDAIASQLL